MQDKHKHARVERDGQSLAEKVALSEEVQHACYILARNFTQIFGDTNDQKLLEFKKVFSDLAATVVTRFESQIRNIVIDKKADWKKDLANELGAIIEPDLDEFISKAVTEVDRLKQKHSINNDFVNDQGKLGWACAQVLSLSTHVAWALTHGENLQDLELTGGEFNKISSSISDRANEVGVKVFSTSTGEDMEEVGKDIVQRMKE